MVTRSAHSDRGEHGFGPYEWANTDTNTGTYSNATIDSDTYTYFDTYAYIQFRCLRRKPGLDAGGRRHADYLRHRGDV